MEQPHPQGSVAHAETGQRQRGVGKEDRLEEGRREPRPPRGVSAHAPRAVSSVAQLRPTLCDPMDLVATMWDSTDKERFHHHHQKVYRPMLAFVHCHLSKSLLVPKLTLNLSSCFLFQQLLELRVTKSNLLHNHRKRPSI